MTTGSCPARVMTTSSRSSVTELSTSAYRARDSEYVMVFTIDPPSTYRILYVGLRRCGKRRKWRPPARKCRAGGAVGDASSSPAGRRSARERLAEPSHGFLQHTHLLA